MPELIEIEVYRRTAAAAVGRKIIGIDAPDAWYLKHGADAATIDAAVVGRTITAARRIGKLLLLDLRRGPTLGLRFGMTGRLVLDGVAPIEELRYGSSRDVPEWDRFTLCFTRGGALRMSDPRRLGGVELEPDEAVLGPDATVITAPQLNAALGTSVAPLKACLMDQHRVAGLGNLLVDEILYRAKLDPARPAGALTKVERRRLQRTIVATVADLSARGGSHTGDLMVARVRGGRCPRDGAELLRRTVGGRTTYSCPRHQT